MRLLRACAWCERIHVDGCWLEAAAAIRQLRAYEWAEPPTFTHGACEWCLAGMLGERRSNGSN
jgi:hypothetical protein